LESYLALKAIKLRNFGAFSGKVMQEKHIEENTNATPLNFLTSCP
jgi:hypothetical protein